MPLPECLEEKGWVYMRKLLALLLVLGLLSGVAFAEVRTTGNVNLRKGPGLDYDVLGSESTDVELEYLGETSTDARGVDWYKVSFKGGAAWISSKYAVLSGEDIAPVAYDPDAETVELADCYLQDLEQSAATVGLTNYQEVPSEAPNQYYDDGAILAGFNTVEYIGLRGAGYTVYGVALGMDVETAKQLLLDAGLDLYSEEWDVLVFEHRSDENSYVDVDGHDSCINLYCENGVVVELDWSAYTG